MSGSIYFVNLQQFWRVRFYGGYCTVSLCKQVFVLQRHYNPSKH